jgi:hypothetical protein
MTNDSGRATLVRDLPCAPRGTEVLVAPGFDHGDGFGPYVAIYRPGVGEPIAYVSLRCS